MHVRMIWLAKVNLSQPENICLLSWDYNWQGTRSISQRADLRVARLVPCGILSTNRRKRSCYFSPTEYTICQQLWTTLSHFPFSSFINGSVMNSSPFSSSIGHDWKYHLSSVSGLWNGCIPIRLKANIHPSKILNLDLGYGNCEIWLCVSFGKDESDYYIQGSHIILDKGIMKVFIYKENICRKKWATSGNL